MIVLDNADFIAHYFLNMIESMILTESVYLKPNG